MDALLLARIQFAMTVGFHFLFPPITLGLTLFVFIIETMYLKTNDAILKTVSSFFIKILALVFAVGVATGITMEFAFGTNWAEYSRMVGDIFGAPLAAEAIFSFFLESTFMGILIFGRNKVSKRVYWMSALFVMIGSHLSGLWILIANSWMQTPAGYEIVGGVAKLSNFFEAAVNHSTLQRFLHTIFAGWLTGAFFTAGISAWYLIKKKHIEYAKKSFAVSIAIIFIATFLQGFAGHAQSVQVAKTQPAKMAAFEALWETQTHAPLALIGWPSSEDPSGIKSIAVPNVLSMLIDFDPNFKVKGLKEFMPSEDFDKLLAEKNIKMFNPNDPSTPDVRPPVKMTFFAYHIMISLAGWFVLLSFVAAFLFWKKKLYDCKLFLWAILLSIPLPQICNQTGWIAAEVGRQPWVIYKMLPTSKAVSLVVGANQILFTIIMFALIYALLFAVFMFILLKLIKKGPVEVASKEGY